MSSDFETDILFCFIDEAEEALVHWERACLDLESQENAEAYNALFRAAHNIKGASRAVGLETFGQFVHEVEDVIQALLNKRLPLNAGLLSSLLESQVILRDWLQELRTDKLYTPDTSAMVSTLRLHASTTSVDESLPPSGAAQEAVIEDPLEAAFWAAKAEFDAKQAKAAAPADATVSSRSATPTEDRKERKQRADETIRISAGRLDELIQLIGELSIHQAIITEGRRTATTESKTVQHALQLSEKLSKDLHTKALSLRMQPLGGLFQLLERTVKDVARAQGKQVVVAIEGSDVDLDKAVIEGIKDPLVHIVRNAVDHGIEVTPQERESVGKKATAVVTISASQEASGVCIRVAEDGRGLNREKIIAKALERGLISNGANLTPDEVYKLIFRPGFSTAEVVTDISGRGVGMDVVQRSVDALRGTISIETELGKGTTFSVFLPTSLSIIDALVIRISSVRYAVPMSELTEIIDLSNLNIETSGKNARMISLRGEVLPVCSLREHLPLEASAIMNHPADTISGRHGSPALIVRSALSRVAFEIDDIVGQQQVVVRKLHQGLEGIRGLSGCTILGDGEPGMILSLSELAHTQRVAGGRNL